MSLFECAGKGTLLVQSEDNSGEELLGCLSPWHVSQAPSFLQPDSGTWEPFRLNDAVNLLVSLAVVRRGQQGDNRSVSMHPLAQTWARIRQTPEQIAQSLRTTECVVALAEYESHPWRPWKDRFGPHVQRLIHTDGTLIEQAARSRHILQLCFQIACVLIEPHWTKTSKHFLRMYSTAWT